MSNTVAGRLQFDNSQECIAKKRQWRRHANENTLERNVSIEDDVAVTSVYALWYITMCTGLVSQLLIIILWFIFIFETNVGTPRQL